MVDYTEIVQGGDEAALRTFIAVHSSNLFSTTDREQTQILIGEPPAEEPLHSLAVPPQTQVAGSITYPEHQTQLLLLSALAPAEVKAFYEDALAQMGWQSSAGSHMRTGFMGTQVEIFNFCNESTHQMLYGHIQADEDRTYIRMTLSKSLQPCQDPHGYMKYMSAMPNLSAPKGVSLLPSSFSSGSTGGTNRFEIRSGAVARWAGTLSELYQAYVPLLETAGWALDTDSITDKAALSWWDVRLDDETWQGVFSVLAKPKSSEYYTLTLTLELSII